jgi:hypothetical protein
MSSILQKFCISAVAGDAVTSWDCCNFAEQNRIVLANVHNMANEHK